MQSSSKSTPSMPQPPRIKMALLSNVYDKPIQGNERTWIMNRLRFGRFANSNAYDMRALLEAARHMLAAQCDRFTSDEHATLCNAVTNALNTLESAKLRRRDERERGGKR